MTSYLTIAGSGPSAKDYPHKVDVATKKRDVDSEYVVVCHVHFWRQWPKSEQKKKLMVYFRHCNCRKCGDCQAPIDFSANVTAWDEYYAQFEPRNPKPSTGASAVFCVVERWKPKTIGLIGYDWILDGNPKWFHDAEAERRAIMSLVNIKDLRNDNFIRRIRPEGGVCLPRFLSVGH